MQHNFFNLPQSEQKFIISEAGNKYKFPVEIIEKDLWICWLLKILFELPAKISFKGGTSLSKGFDLIQRFSEDVDITIDYKNFKEDIDFNSLSKSQLKKISKELKSSLSNYIAIVIVPFLEKKIREQFNENNIYNIKLTYDEETIEFGYKTIFDNSLVYLRDHVLLEFGCRNTTDPCEEKIITPYLFNIAGDKVIFPAAKVNILSPVRTFWEKVTLIHAECNRDKIVTSPHRLSRHWYDLYLLLNSWVKEIALSEINILHNVINYKKAFYNSATANFDNCLNGKLRLVPSDEGVAQLRKDFEAMIKAGMFYAEPITFENIIDFLQNFENDINKNMVFAG